LVFFWARAPVAVHAKTINSVTIKFFFITGDV
jgi:hypothetical protein